MDMRILGRQPLKGGIISVIPFFRSSYPAVPIRARTEGPVIQRTSRANSYACVPQVSLVKYVKKVHVTFVLTMHM